MIKLLKLWKQIANHRYSIKASLLPGEKLRFVNWYLLHGCDLSCSYCKVPKQKIRVMDRNTRKEALKRISTLCARKTLISIIGGEPTLRPDLLVGAVQDAVEEGFLVNIVTDGWGLTPDLIKRLGTAGLHHLAISVDCHESAEKANLVRALKLHAVTKQEGILPVINTVITRDTDIATFKRFSNTIMRKGVFLSPLVCSPEVPKGVFSSALPMSVPATEQLRKIVPWLIWKKLTTGLVTASFGYLLILLRSGNSGNGKTHLWHCSPTFRSKRHRHGRGYITLDSDGFIGPCQEFPRLVNIFDIPLSEVTLTRLDEKFTGTTKKCPGCLHNCYVMEEEVGGLKTLAEIPMLFQMVNIKINREFVSQGIAPKEISVCNM